MRWGSIEDDELEVEEENSNTKQEISDNDINEVATVELETNKTVRNSCFISKDGTRWRKHFTRRWDITTRMDNIITRLPGVKGETNQKIWSLFITDSMFCRQH